MTTSLLGSIFKITNVVSFSFLYNEILEDEIYRFESNHDKPLILDFGANIGVSILHFKKLYSFSEIIAFEPDPKIFELLSENVKQANFSDVVLINNAIWDSESEISFYAEGGDAGRIAH